MARLVHGASRLLVLLVVASTLVGPASAAPVESPLAPPERGLRIGFVADAQESGARPGLRAALEDVDAWGAAFLLYGGDTNYGYGDAPRDWRDAMRPFEDRTLFVYGNHDHGGGYASYQPRGAQDDAWWTWAHGGVVVVGLDTNAPLRNGTPQRAWLEETLRAHRDDVVIVAMHISWWAPNVYHKPNLDFPGEAGDMDALVRENRVDLVLGAHEHYYARWDHDGTPYVVNGAVEAQTRDVPRSVKTEAERTSSERTWMRLEVVDCGIAGWTLTRRSGEVDAFFAPHEDARGGVRDGEAYCEDATPAAAPPEEAQGPPATSAEGSDGGAPSDAPADDDAPDDVPPALLPRLLLGGALVGGIGGATWFARRRRP